MAKRRRPSKVERFQASSDTEGTAREMRILGAIEHTKPVVQDLKLSVIRPDPQNPRRSLAITSENFLDDPDNHDEPVRSALEGIRSLAATIKEEGLLQSIEVYNTGPQALIVVGHRRYWASRYLLETSAAEDRWRYSSIRAAVHSTKPTTLRRRQLIENLQREDLSLADEFCSVRMAWEEYAQTTGGQRGPTVVEMTEKLGCSARADRVWRPLLDPTTATQPGLQLLLKLLDEGRFEFLHHLAEALPYAKQGEAELINYLASKQKGSAAQPVQKVKPTPRGRQRVVKVAIPYKSTGIRRLMEVAAQAGLPVPQKVNWENKKDVVSALAKLLEELDA